MKLPRKYWLRAAFGILLVNWCLIGRTAAQGPTVGLEAFASVGAAPYDPGCRFCFSIVGFGAVPAPRLPNRLGVNAGGGVAYRPTGSGSGYSSGFGFEFEANVMRQRRQSTASSQTADRSATVTLYTGSVLYHFLNQRPVQPYVLIGGGGIRDSGRGNGGALTLGLGAKIFVTPRVSIRPAVQIFGNWDTSFVRYSGAIGYHW